MSPGARGRKRRTLVVAAATVALLGGGAIVFHETRRAERDRHEILDQMRKTESLIRAHDMGLWVNVEAGHGKTPPPADDAAHDQMKRDFERLGHLVDFRMADVRVHVAGDVATATYRIVARPKPPSVGPGFSERPESVPRSGELRFERRAGRWTMAANRLIE
jgi:hypothetical protein